MMSSIRAISFDCADQRRVTEFWAAVLGYVLDEHEALVAPDGRGPALDFQPVAEGKTVKNRVHLDLTPHGPMQAEVDRLISLGARRLTHIGNGPEHGFTVMQDPEGNEFCVEQPREA